MTSHFTFISCPFLVLKRVRHSKSIISNAQRVFYGFLPPGDQKNFSHQENDKSIKTFLFLFIAALLSGTLRTYQRAGCDHDYLQLICPRGTTISIEFVQYGKYGNNEAVLCPDTTEDTQSDGNIITSGTEIEIKTPEKCMWPQAQQVSPLKAGI